jgi:sugar/nucleoside kinase (ribokinase family)
MRFDLVAVGEVLLDVTLDSFAPGETRHAPVHVRAGGTAVNAALAAAAEGARVAVVGRVGSDAAAEAIHATLRRAGVEPLLATDPTGATGTFVEAVVDGARTVVTDRGASGALLVDDLPAVGSAGTLVSGYLLLRDQTRAAAAAALVAFGSDVVGVTAGSSSLLEGLDLVQVRRWAQGASLFVANDAEARTLTGLSPDDAALELARAFGTGCVTVGSAGAVAASRGRLQRAVDDVARASGATASGAGDALAGVLVAALAGGRDLGDALKAGVSAGSRAAGNG